MNYTKFQTLLFTELFQVLPGSSSANTGILDTGYYLNTSIYLLVFIYSFIRERYFVFNFIRTRALYIRELIKFIKIYNLRTENYSLFLSILKEETS